MSKLLDFISTVTASNEDDVENLLLIKDPGNADVDELGKAFTDELGYNPITYFDERSIDEALGTLIDHIGSTSSAFKTITNRHDEISNDILKYLNDTKLENIVEGISHVVIPLLNIDSDIIDFKKSLVDAFGINFSDDSDKDSIPIDDDEESIDEFIDDEDADDESVDVDDFDEID